MFFFSHFGSTSCWDTEDSTELLTELKGCSHIAEALYTGMNTLNDIIIFPHVAWKGEKTRRKQYVIGMNEYTSKVVIHSWQLSFSS